MFAFYMTGSLASSGIQSFAVTSMVQFHGITLDAANMVLTGFLAANAIGILVGGYLADRSSRQGPIIVASMQHAVQTVLGREIADEELAATIGGQGLVAQMQALDAERASGQPPGHLSQADDDVAPHAPVKEFEA